MTATIPYIQDKFNEYNTAYFEGKLPPVRIALSNARTWLGMCTSRTRRSWTGILEHYDFKLKISTRIDLPEQEIQDTIIHEMIHYYIQYFGIRDTSAHGKVFRSMMDRINRESGRNIRISHRLTAEQREQATDKRMRWHVVAIVTFLDGRQGIKLITNREDRITAWHRALSRSGRIENIEYYLEQDPWFNRFPTSSAYNVFTTDMNKVREHITGRKRLMVTPKSVSVVDMQ